MVKTADPIQSLFALFDQAGDRSFGESVTVLTHSLQTAECAKQQGEPDAIVVAALLHDVGHLIIDEDDHIASRVIDTAHEESGADYLARWFKPEVVEPGRLHVAAKRYLCTTDPGYLKSLSTAAHETLTLQGGPMNQQACMDFEANPYARQALTLRRYIDQDKDVGMTVAPLRSYEPLLRKFLL